MSKITEYLKLIPKGLPHSKEILQSIVNNVQMKWGHLPEEQVNEIVRRRSICAQCPFMSKNAIGRIEYFQLTGETYKTRRTDGHCSLCGCAIEGKTAAFAANCGIESWNSEHPERSIPLKWTKFDTDGT